MKGRYYRILCALAVFALCFSEIYTVCLADNYDEQVAKMQEEEAQTQATISNLEKQTEETKAAISLLQGQRQQTESNVSNLKNQSSALQNTVEGYSDQLEDLTEEIEEAESAMAEVSAQIIALNQQVEETKAEKEERYELLKKRIKKVYESGGTKGMWQVILGAGSLTDFFNRYEYLGAMVSYDQQKIAEYRALEEELERQLSEVKAREAELDAYQDTLDEKHGELSELSEEVKSQLNSTNRSILAESGKLADYDNQLVELDKAMKSLESKVAAAQAALAKQVAERLALKREDTSGSYAASASELEWLAATIQAEADGESYTGKLAVGSVIMNRVKSSAFPNDIKSVITQNMQFASYRSGKVELIIQKGPNSTCVKAAQEVLGGARVGDYLFFMTKYYADYYGISEYTMIGNHAFFYRWVTKDKASEPVQEEEQTEQTEEQKEENTNTEEAPTEEEHQEEESHEEEQSEEEEHQEEEED